MAKTYIKNRMIDSDFRKLDNNAKLIFYHLQANCDHGGFVDYDADMIDLLHGFNPGTTEGLICTLGNFIKLSSDKKHCWLPRHLEEQSNLPLSYSNNAHKGALRLIRQNRYLFRNILNLLDSLPAKDKDGNSMTAIELIEKCGI